LSISAKNKMKKEPKLGSDIRVDGFFDIETSDWDKFAIGGYYDPQGGFVSFTDEDEFFDYLLSRGGHVWAWNGGLFDSLWFLNIATRRGLHCRVSTAGTRVTRIEIFNLVLRDACALVPSSLADAAPIGGMELSKDTGLPCYCANECGGYCSITPRCEGMPESWIDSLRAYLELDCVAGWRILDSLFAHAHNNNYKLKGTLGGSAWATAQERLGLPDADWKDSSEYKQARSGYYGGRVTVGRVYAEVGYRYDINSAYPAALSNLELPIGNRIRCYGKAASRLYAKGAPGIYHATVTVPRDCHLPPLPMRTPHNRLCYPVGRFAGDWTALELSRAQRYGVTIEKIWYGIVWGETAPVFKAFMKEVFDVRAKVGKKSALGKWQKFFGNSLTGKFAQSPENERISINPDMSKRRFCPGGDCGAASRRDCRARNGRCCNHRCVRKCRAWKQVDIGGRIWSMPFWSLPDCSHVHWAAYLTAWTRGTWLEFARQFGERFVYGDTDSVYALHEPYDKRNVGSELGQWSGDGQMYEFEALGPKAYRFLETAGDEYTPLQYYNRLKGVPNVENADWQNFKDGIQIVSERGVMGFRSAARKSDRLFAKKLIKRSDLSDGVWYGDRRLIPGTVITKPVTYGAQCARERD